MTSMEPTTPKERIANEALDLIDRRCAEEGLDAKAIFVTFYVDKPDADDDNAASAFRTDEEDLSVEEAGRELFAFLVAQVRGVGQALGLTVHFGRVDGGPMS